MRFGIVGDPVMHSRSPAIHSAGFVANGIDASFEFLPTPSDGFDLIERMLRSEELDGVSVTMPHKANAYQAVDLHTDLAQRTGAVNTITTRNGALVGTNTDVAGARFAVGVASAEVGPVLVLGAGGAAAAAIVALEGRRLFVSARSEDRAHAVLGRTGVQGTVVPWAEGVAGSVVVNATPLGMHGESLPDGVLGVASGIIDMTYGDSETPACAYAIANGLRHADGLDMVVGQALEAFTLFTGLNAPLDVFYSAARGDTGP